MTTRLSNHLQIQVDREYRGDLPRMTALPTKAEYQLHERDTLERRGVGAFPIEVPDAFQIIAHRGASGYAHEHTDRAFEIARTCASEVELDVRITKDGVVVVIHDADLAKHGLTGVVEESNYWGGIDQIRIPTWQCNSIGYARILTLPEVLSKYRDHFKFHIEFKSEDSRLVPEVGEIIDASGLQGLVLFTSEHAPQLIQAREQLPHIPRGLLCHYLTEEALELALSLQCLQICPRADLLSPQIVAFVKDYIPQVRAWGLAWNTKEYDKFFWRASQVVNSGCDGATINEPDFFVHTSKVSERGVRFLSVT